jgi:Ca-activated chloride channel family protein
MTFTAPYYNLLVIALPLLLAVFGVWTYRRTRRALAKFAAAPLLPKIINPAGLKLRPVQWVLRIVSLAFISFSLSGPQWGYHWQNVSYHATEIIFAIDTSKSMMAVDIKPNRLERAKLAVKDFLLQNPGSKVGLIAFSGASFLQCPLTIDYNAFNTILDSLNVNSIPKGGTAIGAAVQTATKAFQAGSSGSKALILITDGENHEGDPVAATRTAAKQGIKVFTVGIGSTQGDLILAEDEKGNKTYIKDEQGNVVKSALNETILKAMAAAGNGVYVRGVGPTLGLEQLYRNRLSGLNRTTTTSHLQKKLINRYQIPLLIGLILLVTEILLPFRVKNGSSEDASAVKGMDVK